MLAALNHFFLHAFLSFCFSDYLCLWSPYEKHSPKLYADNKVKKSQHTRKESFMEMQGLKPILTYMYRVPSIRLLLTFAVSYIVFCDHTGGICIFSLY